MFQVNIVKKIQSVMIIRICHGVVAGIVTVKRLRKRRVAFGFSAVVKNPSLNPFLGFRFALFCSIFCGLERSDLIPMYIR